MVSARCGQVVPVDDVGPCPEKASRKMGRSAAVSYKRCDVNGQLAELGSSNDSEGGGIEEGMRSWCAKIQGKEMLRVSGVWYRGLEIAERLAIWAL
jgi:hypothetical protein